MLPERRLDWDGCFNVRDLGGLPARDGRRIRPGALVRADALEHLSADGWAALAAHGVRTVVDLRNDDEVGEDVARRPSAVRTLRLPLDGAEDREFWDVWESGPQFGTPLYYGPHLDRFPRRNAAVVTAIARARPGGVAYHCAGGRDRTGQVTLLLLALAGVAPATIAEDYALSESGARALAESRGEPDQAPMLHAHLASQGTTAAQVIAELLGGLDVAAHLRGAGVADADLDRLRARLLA